MFILFHTKNLNIPVFYGQFFLFPLPFSPVPFLLCMRGFIYTYNDHSHVTCISIISVEIISHFP